MFQIVFIFSAILRAIQILLEIVSIPTIILLFIVLLKANKFLNSKSK